MWVPAVSLNGRKLRTGDTPTAFMSTLIIQPGSTTDKFDLEEAVYNSNVFGNARFRDAYRVDYRGFMFVVDMKYDFEEVYGLSVAAAGGYISGDKYPFNDEKNKRYKAFLPYGDYNYNGKFVLSQIVLNDRKLPRPVNFSYHDQYAHNNVKDMSNLVYLGTGVSWKPFAGEEKNKLKLQSNVMFFWQNTTLKKWDKMGRLPKEIYYGDDISNQKNIGERWQAHELTDIGSNSYVWYKGDTWDCGHPVGWQSNNDASRHLGTELNFEAQYRPVKNCILLAQLACFVPGQLYKDLDGQPNINTHNGPKASEGVYGLGHDLVWRAAMSLDYRF